MTQLDDELRDALRRKEPPAGFAERVLRRAANDQPTGGPLEPQRRTTTSPRVVIRWAAAAALVVAVAGGIEYRAARERAARARAEAAKEQVLEALRLAGSKLHLVQSKIKGIGS